MRNTFSNSRIDSFFANWTIVSIYKNYSSQIQKAYNILIISHPNNKYGNTILDIQIDQVKESIHGYYIFIELVIRKEFSQAVRQYKWPQSGRERLNNSYPMYIRKGHFWRHYVLYV